MHGLDSLGSTVIFNNEHYEAVRLIVKYCQYFSSVAEPGSNFYLHKTHFLSSLFFSYTMYLLVYINKKERKNSLLNFLI